MRRLRPVLLLSSVLLALCVAAAPAHAANAVIQDCSAHGKLTRHYSVAQLRTALDSISAASDEYGDCGAVIQNQIYAELKVTAKQQGGGGSSTGLIVVIVVVIVLVAAAGGGLALSRARKQG